MEGWYNMKRKFKVVLTGLVLIISLVGCNDRKEENADAKESVVSEISTEEDVDIITEKETTELSESTTEATEITEQTTEDVTTEITVEISTTNENEIPEAYRVVLDSLYAELLLSPDDEMASHEYFTTGIWEVAIYGDTADDRLNMISYQIEDINNDGILELIIFDNSSQEGVWKDRVLDLYTISDSEAVGVVTGWARNRYYILDDYTIYNEGSGGAAYSICESFTLEQGATELTTHGIYFTYPKDNDYDNISYFYSAEGIYDVTVATEITQEEYTAFRDGCLARVKSFDAKTFSEYK